jgi:preprotein translocase subunit SecG
MIVGFFTTLLFLNGILLIFIILMQKSKGSMGMSALGGSTQILFGGSGGQDLFQKVTWVMGAIFMIGSLMLAILKSHEADGGTLLNRKTRTQQNSPVKTSLPIPAQTTPQQKS